jgi:hypothetical protein
VEVFGTRSSSAGSLNDVAVAAKPVMWTGIVTANPTGGWIVTTSHHGTITVPTGTVSPPMAKQFTAAAKSHRPVKILLSPVTHTVLAVHVKHLSPRARAIHRQQAILNTTTIGTLTSDSSSALTVANALGTQTVNIAGVTVKVRWAHHPDATLEQIPQGSRLWIHAVTKTKTVLVHVLSTHTSA